MRNLRKRKFGIYVTKHRSGSVQNRRRRMEDRDGELTQQIETWHSTQSVDAMSQQIKLLEQQRCALIESTTKQIDDLRDIIKNLAKARRRTAQIKLTSKANSFISIS